MSIQCNRVWKFGDHVDTDAILPAKYLNLSLPEKLAIHCMEGMDPAFSTKVGHGDVLVGGKNFGCGSSREQAPISIKAAGISCIVAESFARIFFRNCFTIGLPIAELPHALERIEEGDKIEIDFEMGILRNITREQSYEIAIQPQFMREIIAAGGLVHKIKKDRREKEK